MVRKHSCRCRTCPECGGRYGRKVRYSLLDRAKVFQHPKLFTLTLKPGHFGDCPMTGYLTVVENRYVARLMRHLGVTRWVWVLEFQKSGWAHWHVLIDAPNGRIDLKRAWKYWGWNRAGWKLGGLDLGKQQARDGREAVRYITKYLIKYPDHGFPDWLLDLDRKIRWVQASRAVGPVISDTEPTEADAKKAGLDEVAQESLPVEHRTLRIRMFTCGTAIEFLREAVNKTTGEVRYSFAGRLDVECLNVFDWGEYVRRMGCNVDERGNVYVMANDTRTLMYQFMAWSSNAEGLGLNRAKLSEMFGHWRRKCPLKAGA